MSVTPSVQDVLRHANVPYAVFPHTPAYTAAAEAAISDTASFRRSRSRRPMLKL
jgi:hypothetical protein